MDKIFYNIQNLLKIFNLEYFLNLLCENFGNCEMICLNIFLILFNIVNKYLTFF